MCTDCEIGLFERLAERAVGNAEAGEFGRIRLHDKGFRIAANRVDACHTWDSLELWTDAPVLAGAQVARFLALTDHPVALGRAAAALGLPPRLARYLPRPLAVGMCITHLIPRIASKSGGGKED